MTPTAIFLGATAMTTGAGADTVERPSESDAPGMKAEPMSEGTRSMLRATKEKVNLRRRMSSSALAKGLL